MASINIQTVGVAQDASFVAQDGKQVVGFIVPVTGSVDGGPSAQVNLKIYGKGGDTKFKSGMTVNGMLNAQFGHYDVKKADNPQLFAAPSNTNNFRKPYQKSTNYEVQGLKIAIELLKQQSYVAAEYDVMAAADKAIKVAQEKIIPFLRASEQRHDQAQAAAKAETITNDAIRTIVNNNGLTATVQNNNLTMGQLKDEYEQAGNDATKFISNLRAKFQEAPAIDPLDDGDDIPF